MRTICFREWQMWSGPKRIAEDLGHSTLRNIMYHHSMFQMLLLAPNVTSALSLWRCRLPNRLKRHFRLRPCRRHVWLSKFAQNSQNSRHNPSNHYSPFWTFFVFVLRLDRVRRSVGQFASPLNQSFIIIFINSTNVHVEGTKGPSDGS